MKRFGLHQCERTQANRTIEDRLADFGVTLDGEMEGWTYEHKYAVWVAVSAVGQAFAQTRGRGETAAEAFRAVYGWVTFTWETECYYCRDEETRERCGSNFAGDCAASGGVTLSAHHIMFASMAGDHIAGYGRQLLRRRNNVVHELGHAFDHVLGFGGRTAVSGDWSHLNRNPVEGCRDWENCGFASPLNQRDWVMNRTNENYEIFADQFLGWTFGRWEHSLLGDTRRDWMNTNMAKWLDDF